MLHKTTFIHSFQFSFRTIKSVITVWIDTYPEDFRDPPSYKCLVQLETFTHIHLPDSDLNIRVKHKMDKFRKEDASSSGMYLLIFLFNHI